ncbi:uncharacterized protein LOC141762887 isoform X1 [Sebastes fasciatus]|uniref:uncharacterized protein LOC141762887 isoform X1 n=1 Tax=Sebastes fasciatus TaxID=394691 RepID=UPI003D9DDEBC
MNIHIVLFFCFLTGALCDGTTGTSRCINATEGGNIRVQCSLLSVRNVRKFFCENDCRGDDVLVVTSGSGAQNGRFSLEVDSQRLYVNIAQLVKSDSGRYRCGVRRGRPRFTASYDFDLCVTDARSEETTAPTAVPETNKVSTAPSAVPETNKVSTGLVLVSVGVPVVVVLLVVVLLFFYKTRTKRSDGTNKTGNTDSTKTQIVPYENWPPGSTRPDSTYQDLDPATRNQNQIYWTLTHTQDNTKDHV